MPRAREAVLDLEQAAGIARGDDGRAGGRDVVELSLEELVGHLGLDEVVDARAAAAPHRLGQRLDVEAGDFREQLARLHGDLLPVAEMAGVVIGDAGLRARLPFSGARKSISTSHSLMSFTFSDHCAAFLRGVLRIVLKQPVEMLEMRAATGGVGDDGVEIIEIEVIEQAARIALGHFVFAVVRVERAAAGLRSAA